jgi:hypothetical protein
MQMTIERRCRGVLPHYFEDGVLWATRGNHLVCSHDLGGSFVEVARLVDGAGRAFSRVRAIDRFAHITPFALVPFGDGAVAFAGRGLSRWHRGADRFQPLEGPIDFRPMRRGVCAATDGALYVGEYRDNGGEHRTSPRAAVHIWRFDGSHWTTAWRFPEDTVRHVHAVIEHPVRSGTFFVCTGDTDAESVIWITTDGFTTLTPWRTGGQQTRTCDLVFLDGSLVWGIDSPLETSGICRVDGLEGSVQRLCDTPGPIYYGARNEAGHLWFGTSVEPGPSVVTDRVHLYASTDGGRSFADVFSRRADRTPQLSSILFPRGTAPGSAVVFSLRATWRWEGQMVVGRLSATA